MSDAVTYSKVSSEITSIIGQTTALRFLAISAKRGSNQPSVHSQCASKKVITFPLTCFAPERENECLSTNLHNTIFFNDF